MDSKQLESLGLTVDQASKVLEWAAETSEALKLASNSLLERDAQIESLKGFQGDADGLKKQVAELQQANKESALKHAEELKGERKLYLVKQALNNSDKKPHDMGILMSQLDMNSVKVNDDGSIEGLQEQTASLYTTKPFLFSVAEAKDVPILGVNVRGKSEAVEVAEKPSGLAAGDFGKLLANRSLNK